MSTKYYTLNFSDGSNSAHGISYDGAMLRIATKCNINRSELVVWEDASDRPRVLVWTSENKAADDTGENAVAELVPA